MPRTEMQEWQFNRYMKLKGGLTFMKGLITSMLIHTPRLSYIHQYERGILHDILRNIDLSLMRFNRLTRDLKDEITGEKEAENLSVFAARTKRLKEQEGGGNGRHDQ